MIYGLKLENLKLTILKIKKIEHCSIFTAILKISTDLQFLQPAVYYE